MEETDLNQTRHDQSLPSPSSSSSFPVPTPPFEDVSALSSQPSTSQVREEQQHEEESGRPEGHLRLQHRRSVVSYRATISQAMRSEMRDDVWSCLVLLVTFWLFAASMTLIMGLYGSSNLELGPNCSRLIQTNPLFVQSIKVEEQDETKPGPILYGFSKPPPMDVEINWIEIHNNSVPSNSHKEWIYFLNPGSQVDVLLNVKSPSSPPLLLIIAQGRESLVEWIEDPSYPNTTLSWNIIHGRGKIKQEITRSSSYYIAVGNLNSEEIEVELEFKIKSFHYNTTQAYYQCIVGNSICSLKLSILGAKTAVLTSPPHDKVSPAGDDWFVKLSYGPQWLTYFIGSGLMTVIMLLAFRFCSRYQNMREFQSVEVGAERTPLLLPKDDDVSSWGSSYDSVSHDEEEDHQVLQVLESSLEGKAINEGENNSSNSNNTRRLCVICCDCPRDCFFLPCGHCAACFTCGTRIAEEDGQCPICRRKMKKVRKIFSV